MQTRRGYLAAVAGSAVAVAGCIGDISTDSPTETPTARRDPYRLEPGEYETIVIFRNDDPHPGFKEDALEKVEEIFIDAAVPLTHGVIPMAERPDADSSFCRTLRNRAIAYPDLFEFSLHGYTHAVETEFYGASEFGGVAAETQREWIRDGANLLADCVDVPPSSFIPPYNTYDDHTVDALRSAGLRIVSGGWWFTDSYYGESRLFENDGVLHVPMTHDVVKRYEPLELFDRSTLQAAFDEAHEPGGLFVPMIHYQHFEREEPLEKLRSFVRYIQRQDGVGFMTLSGFGEAYLDDDIERDEDGWLYAPS